MRTNELEGSKCCGISSCCRKLNLPPVTPIKAIYRTDSSAATYAFTQWVAEAGNKTWSLGVNKTLPAIPGVQSTTGGGNVTKFIQNTPFSIGSVLSLSMVVFVLLVSSQDKC